MYYGAGHEPTEAEIAAEAAAIAAEWSFEERLSRMRGNDSVPGGFPHLEPRPMRERGKQQPVRYRNSRGQRLRFRSGL